MFSLFTSELTCIAGINATNATIIVATASMSQGILKSREYWNKQKEVYSIGSYTSNEEK